MSVRLFCAEGDHEAVESAIKALKGVESVASLPNKKGRNVFAKFASEEDANAALDTLKSNTKVVIPGEKKPKAGGDAAASTVAASKKSKNVVGEFFRYDPYQSVADQNRQGGDAQQQQSESAGPSNGAQQRERGRGGQRGRGGHGRGRGRGGQGPRGPRVPMIQGHVAVLDNVPINATNDQIAKAFLNCGGTIYDINRLENMAMVYFDSVEAVQEAILAMNGQKMQNNIVTVSSGGSVRVPAPMAPPPQQPPRQQQQQFAVPPAGDWKRVASEHRPPQ